MGWGRQGAAQAMPGLGAETLQGKGSWRQALAPGASTWPWTSLLGGGGQETHAVCSGQINSFASQWAALKGQLFTWVLLTQTAFCSSGPGVCCGCPCTSWHSPSAALWPDWHQQLLSCLFHFEITLSRSPSGKFLLLRNNVLWTFQQLKSSAEGCFCREGKAFTPSTQILHVLCRNTLSRLQYINQKKKKKKAPCIFSLFPSFLDKL